MRKLITLFGVSYDGPRIVDVEPGPALKESDLDSLALRYRRTFFKTLAAPWARRSCLRTYRLTGAFAMTMPIESFLYPRGMPWEKVSPFVARFNRARTLDEKLGILEELGRAIEAQQR